MVGKELLRAVAKAASCAQIYIITRGRPGRGWGFEEGRRWCGRPVGDDDVGEQASLTSSGSWYGEGS